MRGGRWIFPLALCFICVSSYNEEYYEDFCSDFCKTQILVAPLGSSVLLPCIFTNNGLSRVSWAHTTRADFVHFSAKGRISFLDPKSGRVKAFPNQGSKGNYSIRIDELEDSDLGCYRCIQEGACLQVELSARSDTVSKEMWLLVYICVGSGGFILLGVCSYFIFRNRKQFNPNNPADVANVEGATAGPSAPPQETNRPVQYLQQGAYDNNLIYENDDQEPTNHQGTSNCSNPPGALHDVARTQPTQTTSGLYPNLNQFNFERASSERTKHKFHRELMNRLRQASFSRHYYVNQRELSKQQATSTQAENHHKGAEKKKDTKDEYKNPIYNRSTDHLNRL